MSLTSDFTIIIPTRGRVGKQRTLGKLPGEFREQAFLLAPLEEIKSHPGVPVICAPGNIEEKGISYLRQWVTDYLSAMREIDSNHILVFMDDDLIFGRRYVKSVPMLKTSNEYDIFCMLEEVTGENSPLHVNQALVGVSHRPANRSMERDGIAQRQMQFHAFKPAVFRRHGIKWDKMPLMEDFSVTLQCLTKGLSNLVMCEYTLDQNGSNQPGGCSRYRTLEMQGLAAFALQEAYPDFVTVKEKKTVWKEGFPDTRYDVTVYWKKAYKWGLENNKHAL